ncbi:hypothetical protein Ddc_21086 [Ditylenchus destructor]|nr:hypothetical protein Ddc_21086 [Ditylenchus destructor]
MNVANENVMTNKEVLQRIRELEQGLSNSQAKMRNLETKFAQTDVGQVIAVMKETVDKLENGEISRLSDENEMKNQEICTLRKKLVESEKRIAVMNKEKEEMAKELKRRKHFRQLIDEDNEDIDGILEKKTESKDEQSLPEKRMRRMVPIVPTVASQQQRQEAAELVSDGDLWSRYKNDLEAARSRSNFHRL